MKIGDRVIYNRVKGTIPPTYNGKVATLSNINTTGIRKGFPYQVLITFLLTLSVLEGEVEVSYWCWSDEIELDKEWYREEKLKELGIW